MILTLARRTQETSSVERFFFTPEHSFEFTAGQYLRYILPHPNPDDRGVTRFFSIASAPDLPEIELATHHSQPGSSFKSALFALQPGETVQAAGPAGAFLLPEGETLPVTLVAGGIGITPFHAMLADRIGRSSQRPVTLLYGTRSDDALYINELEAWARAGDGFVLIRQDDQLAAAAILANRLSGSPIFISGPQEMITSLPEALIAEGVDTADIVTDYFPGYGVY